MASQIGNLPSRMNLHENEVGPRKVDVTQAGAQKFAFQDRSNMILKKVAARNGNGTPRKPLRMGASMSIAKNSQDSCLLKKSKGFGPLKVNVGAENMCGGSDLIVKADQAMGVQMSEGEENVPHPEVMHLPNENDLDYYASLPDFELEEAVVHRDFHDEPLDSPYNSNVKSFAFDAHWTV